MGVRLVRYNRNGTAKGDYGTYKHDELENRDFANQHPIQAITGLQEIIDKVTELIIENYKDTNEIYFTHDKTLHELKANIKLYEDDEDTNALKITSKGLYCPKIFTKDTNTIEWATIIKGESLEEIFNSGSRFSHGSGWNEHCYISEENSWYWDNNLQSFVQPQNTSYFNGFITKEYYDKYTHRVTIKSSNSDDDLNGVIIGYVYDSSGNPNTLSLVVDAGGTGIPYGLIYNYNLPNQQVLATYGNTSLGNSRPYYNGGWNNCSNGITLEVIKNQNKILCRTSNWNDPDNLQDATTIEIDLDNYSWGSLFRNEVKYGYCNYSQASSYYQNVFFESKSSASYTTLVASVKISKTKGNLITERDDGIFVDSTSLKIHEHTNKSIIDKIGDTKGNLTYNGKIIGSGGKNTIEINQASHGFSIGDILYCRTDGIYDKALAEDSIKIEVIGIVTYIEDVDNFEVSTSGLVTGTTIADSFNYGEMLYLSDTTPGKLTDSSTLTILKPIGIRLPQGLLINIQRASMVSNPNTNNNYYYSPVAYIPSGG